VNGSITNRQPIPAGNVTPATVKVEPVPVTSMVNGPAFPHNPSVPRVTSNGQGIPSLQTSSPSSVSQDIMTNNENAQDTKPTVSMLQPSRPANPAQANVNILNNLSQVRQVMNSAALSGGTSMGLQSMGQTPVAMHMSNMISSGTTSSGPTGQNVFCTANLQGTVSMGQQVPGMNPGNLSGAQMVQGGVNMNQNVMNGLTQSGVSSGTGAMIPTPGMPQQVQSGMQPLVNNALLLICLVPTDGFFTIKIYKGLG
ncbi:mediator of RNA polymerase II transcription subunit 25-like protein, partial [Trifolium pratense]